MIRYVNTLDLMCSEPFRRWREPLLHPSAEECQLQEGDIVVIATVGDSHAAYFLRQDAPRLPSYLSEAGDCFAAIDWRDSFKNSLREASIIAERQGYILVRHEGRDMDGLRDQFWIIQRK